MGSISFSNALGVHEQALHLRTRRAAVLANNLANADTPGFKARDFNLQKLLAEQKRTTAGSKLAMRRTHAGHIGGSGVAASGPELQYRNPLQPSVDGNTVDAQDESGACVQNTWTGNNFANSDPGCVQ